MKKNTKNNTMLKIILFVAAVLITVILNSCGAVELSAPTDLQAADPDPDNPNRIEISWLPVEGAGIYYVYRSGSKTGTYSYTGLSVTSSEVEGADGTTQTRYFYIQSFEEGDGGIYYYRVTAASNDYISMESAMSAAVEAYTYSGTWSKTPYSLGNASQLRLAADDSALYAVYSTGDASAVISTQKYAEDEDSDADEPPMIWTELTGTPGTTDGGADGPFSIFISDSELYVVFNDAGSSGAVSMQYYHDSGTTDSPAFSWEAVGSTGFNGAAATGLSAATVGFAGDIYTAFLEGSEAQLYKNNTEIYLLDSMASIDPVEDLSAIAHSNTLYFGYEQDSKLYLREFDSTFETLETVESGDEIVSSAIDDGNAVFVSGGGDLYAVYVTSGGAFEAEKLTDGTWAPLSNTSGKPVTSDGPYGTLDAHWYNGYLYVFYLDGSGDGRVKYYDTDEGWQNAEKSDLPVTDEGTITAVQLASSSTMLFAGYIEDGQARVKILE